MNIYRRHLSAEQIAAWFERIWRDHPDLAKQIIDVDQVKAFAAATKSGNLRRGGSRERQMTPSGKTAQVKAAALNISPTAVERVERVAREAPEALEQLERGEKSSAMVLREQKRTVPIQKKKKSKPIAPAGGPPKATPRTSHTILSELPAPARAILDRIEHHILDLFPFMSPNEKTARTRELVA
jgi:hypothetical protein